MKNELHIPYFIPNPEYVGVHIFTFDGEKTYNLFRDYPKALTPEEKALFDRTFPFWANFFKTD